VGTHKVAFMGVAPTVGHIGIAGIEVLWAEVGIIVKRWGSGMAFRSWSNSGCSPEMQSKSDGRLPLLWCSKKRLTWARVARESESSGGSCSPKKPTPSASTSSETGSPSISHRETSL
jgi:hypothetical protein